MKNTVFIFVTVACIIAECLSIKVSAQSLAKIDFLYSANLVIPASANTKDPMVATSPASDFDQIFTNPTAHRIKAFTAAKIASSDSIKRNLGMFKSIKLYISRSDETNEVLVASNASVSMTAGSSLVLNLNKSAFERNNSPRIDPNQSLEQSLAGLPGVQITPAGDVRIMRGTNTSGGGPPLYMIDGVERNGIQGINPGDVKSMEVLKDASQLAMYGMRGANGVILIKTKGGFEASEKNAGTLDNFVKGSNMVVRVEYVLRNPLKAETKLNVNINFTAAAK